MLSDCIVDDWDFCADAPADDPMLNIVSGRGHHSPSHHHSHMGHGGGRDYGGGWEEYGEIPVVINEGGTYVVNDPNDWHPMMYVVNDPSDWHPMMHVGAASAATETPDSPEHWYDVTGAPSEVADRKYRTLQGDINAAMLNIKATDPRYTPINLLSNDYAGFLGTWDETFPGPWYVETAMIDPAPFDADYATYAARYSSITGLDPSPPVTTAHAAAAATSQAITSGITNPVSSWWSAHTWEMYLGLGAILAYMMLYANARLAGGVQRQMRG